jgi:hypothetical protein
MGLFIMEEVWKDVVGFDKCYRVSNLGNVFSCKSNKLMKKNINNRGYERVTLLDNKQYSVHRLVCLSFFGDIPDNKVVNHKNGIKTDNRLDNLELISQRENCIHYHSKNKLKKIVLKTCIRYEKWMVINGVNRRIGRFKTEEEAMNAYLNKLHIIY